jgi:hypothetical protein
MKDVVCSLNLRDGNWPHDVSTWRWRSLAKYHFVALMVQVNSPLNYESIYIEAKTVLLHATKALGRRGGIGPTHSRPRH